LLKKEHFYPVPYQALPYRVRNEEAQVRLHGQTVGLQVFGRHNSSNISAAWEVCSRMGVSLEEFIQHISTFRGTALRLETIADDGHTRIIRDFAHAPSKVKASVAAVASLFPHRHIVACFELHTFSSLNKTFLSQYRGALKSVRNKIVYVDRNVLIHKQLPPITREEVIRGFRDRSIRFADTKEELLELLQAFKKEKAVYLMMSSGAFSGLDFKVLLG
jgi:UDP-N-acetylmuramate: L-alanyl-gamma-D-glutamyl-meso-diaminopimelate ligase